MPAKTDAFRLNVRKFLSLMGMTQSELAERAELSPQWLNKMLQGKSNPTLPICERIATALGTTLEALVAENTTPSSSVALTPPHFVEKNSLDNYSPIG